MPIKTVSVKCRVCGREAQMHTTKSSVPYWICEDCKLDLEKTPKELMKHIGKAVESEHREKYGAH